MESITIAIRQSPVATFIFLATLATSFMAFRDPLLKQKLMLRPYSLVERKQYHTLLTSGLIHADMQHLIMNMIAYFFFAFSLERVFVYTQATKVPLGSEVAMENLFVYIGHAKFLLFYLLCLILADITTIAKYRTVPSYASLGASGAISGVLVGAVIMAPSMGNQIMIYGFIPGWIFAAAYIAYSYYAAKRNNDNIGHEAHLWGALGGIIFTPMMYPKESMTFVRSVINFAEGLF